MGASVKKPRKTRKARKNGAVAMEQAPAWVLPLPVVSGNGKAGFAPEFVAQDR